MTLGRGEQRGGHYLPLEHLFRPSRSPSAVTTTTLAIAGTRNLSRRPLILGRQMPHLEVDITCDLVVPTSAHSSAICVADTLRPRESKHHRSTMRTLAPKNTPCPNLFRVKCHPANVTLSLKVHRKKGSRVKGFVLRIGVRD